MYFILTIPVDDPNYKGRDVSKTKTILGWEPMADIRKDLANTNEWSKNNQIKA